MFMVIKDNTMATKIEYASPSQQRDPCYCDWKSIRRLSTEVKEIVEQQMHADDEMLAHPLHRQLWLCGCNISSAIVQHSAGSSVIVVIVS